MRQLAAVQDRAAWTACTAAVHTTADLWGAAGNGRSRPIGDIGARFYWDPPWPHGLTR